MVVALSALALAGPARADVNWTTPADALGSRGDQHIVYPGYESTTTSAPWMTVNGVGDVNGDGLDDIGAGFGPHDVYITFSDPNGGVRDATGPNSFHVATDHFWAGLASAGDVNGDGLGDVAIVETNDIRVLFGKSDSSPVTGAATDTGFVIANAGGGVASGGNWVMENAGAVPLGDVNGDGVSDLLVARGGNAAIVYPPRNAAGMTIDASAPGPYVSTFTASGSKRLGRVFVDRLGDINGDGRADVMVAGEEPEGTDQVAYGIVSPEPGAAVDLPSVAAAGTGFELRTHDGQPGWSGGLEHAMTLGDENGDGRREIGMTSGNQGLHVLRVAFSPPLGSKLDIADLGAADARGYAFHPYGKAIDVGDQSGDGRADFATGSYIYFTDPSRETGRREPVYSGFYFGFDQPGFATVVAPLNDVNGDRKPELVVARSYHQSLSPDERVFAGERANYSVDVFDSATAPEIPPPDPPIELPGGALEVPVDVGTGAGTRGGTSLALHPGLEIATPSGPAYLASDGGVQPSGGDHSRLALKVPVARALGGAPLVAGHRYRVRYVAGNGRGLASVGAWRTFAYRPERACPAQVKRRGTRHRDRLDGTGCRDTILGLGGPDVIRGRGGDDLLYGGSGGDLIEGGAGSDGIYGGAGADRIYGGAGSDRIYARDRSRDVVQCGPGKDVVIADRRDRLRGCERVLLPRH